MQTGTEQAIKILLLLNTARFTGGYLKQDKVITAFTTQIMAVKDALTGGHSFKDLESIV